MKNSKALKTVLLFSGLIGVAVGAAILLAPVAFYAASGIELGNDASLLSEIRAPGGALLACGLLIIAGVFIEKMTFTATLVSTLLYLAYGLSRVISIIFDGMPATNIVQVSVMEIAIGLMCAFCLLKFREQPN